MGEGAQKSVGVAIYQFLQNMDDQEKANLHEASFVALLAFKLF